MREFDARFQAHEDYEPGIPDVTVYLESPGPDGRANTADDIPDPARYRHPTRPSVAAPRSA